MEAGKQFPFEGRVISEKALAMAIEDAVFIVLGKALPKASICILLAQSAVETGADATGKRVTANWNAYGIKAYGSQDYFESPTKEGHGATEQRIVAKFRSFPDAKSGAVAFVRLIATAPRYRDAWKKVEAGDPVGYALALGQGGYYTGNPLVYAKGVARHWAWCALRMLNYGVTPDEIRRFQAEHSIGVDGLLGPVTRGALRVALGG